MLRAVQAAQAVQDKRWIPEELEDRGFFSRLDVWHYISISDDRRCWYCEQLDGHDYYGDELRSFFPHLEIRSGNVIDVNLHLTLWNKDTCRCKVVRTFMPREPKLLPEITEKQIWRREKSLAEVPKKVEPLTKMGETKKRRILERFFREKKKLEEEGKQ